MTKYILYLVLFTIVGQSHVVAQQLVLVSRDRIRLRFSEGDPILYVTDNSRKIKRDVIMGFTTDNIILRKDTIALPQLRALGSRSEANRFQDPAYKLMIAGVLLGLGDFINVTAVQDKAYRADPGVVVVSAVLISSGIILLTSKPVVKINRRNRLLMVKEDSHLYR